MGAIRQRLLAEAKSPEAHKLVFERILHGGLLEMIRQDRTEDVTSLLRDELGEDYTWESLMAAA